MCSPGRLIAAGLFTALAELLAAVALLAIAGPQQVSWALGITAGVTAFISIVIRPLLEPRRPRGSDGPGGGMPPREPLPEPPWWPEFEREFRRYVREHTPSPR